jgi:hypothetical protein
MTGMSANQTFICLRQGRFNHLCLSRLSMEL